MRNILEKSYIKCDGEISPRPISGKLRLTIFLDQYSKALYSFVLMVSQVGGYRNILKQICRPLAFTSYYAFLKNKMRSGTSLPASFYA